MSSLLKTLKESVCDCEKCRAMCRKPCWGTPEDISRLIQAGYGDRLMLEYWTGECDKKDIEFPAPALKEFEGGTAPFIPKSEGGCTFWKDGLCELHEKGLKPTEARVVDHGELNKDIDVHGLVAQEWNNEEAQKITKE